MRHRHATSRLLGLPGLCSLLLAAMSSQPANVQAQGGPLPDLTKLPTLELRRTDRPSAQTEAFSAAKPYASTPTRQLDSDDDRREFKATLELAYIDGKLWNPLTQRDDTVRLRGYRNADEKNPARFAPPIIDTRPGDTIRVTLKNRLPADPSCVAGSGGNIPHCFNGTNLHAHGLWVSPAGNSDNVLISINPGVDFQYEYNIPADHPSGTFWYHPHRHGSTAMQVASGVAGALIVRGNRPPTNTQSGDLDTLLRPTPQQAFEERVLVMQQIQYACRNADGTIKTNDQGYHCDPVDVAGVEPGPDPARPYDLFGRDTWMTSGRYTTINGAVLPRFTNAAAGKVERWRVIHGGVRDTINLQVRALQRGAPSPATLTAQQQASYIDSYCTGPLLSQYVVAADGLTTSRALRKDQTVFQPGYRWDILMTYPEPGTYCVIDGAAPANATVTRASHSRRLLALVDAERGAKVRGDIETYLTNALIAAARSNLPASVQDKVVTDLRNGLSLKRFVKHVSIDDAEVTGTQELTFNIDINKTPNEFQIDGRSFDSKRVDRTLKLGGVDEWKLTSKLASHPFHIHVNPFQIVKILDPTGKDVSDDIAVDDAGGSIDVQYQGLKGLWKDTLFVKSLASPAMPEGTYTVIVRTRYERYIGDFVLHCHILDHEDQGMMQNVRISIPDGAGGVASLTHPH